MSYNPDAENALENAFMTYLRDELGYEVVNAYEETFGGGGTLGREARTEFVLLRRLEAALVRLNPQVSREVIRAAITTLTEDRSRKGSLEAANQEVYQLLKEGVKVATVNAFDEADSVTVQVIDWQETANNDFLVVQQFWGASSRYIRRPDIILFVNGLPLVLMELKAVTKKLSDAFYANISDYKDTLRELFWYNAFLLVANGSDARIGTLSASWDYFKPWQRVEAEDEERHNTSETILAGTCAPARLLDIVENFLLFTTVHGGLTKVIAQNHQYLGVNNALAAFSQRRELAGKLGVFWHTTGSGKSYSMVFLAQKVLRKLRGNWTFLIVTDRSDLDKQIYKNFAGSGAITEAEETVRAESGAELKRLLQEDHRYIFTLIQKFHARDGEVYPVLSQRDDIIIITDEAHRTQYGSLASNMQGALPNAAYLAFTGTPLIKGDDEKTREVFGDYVSVYDFEQAVLDGATVPLFYENRIPELELVNEQLDEDIYETLDHASLDAAAELALEQQFSREYAIITRDDRLERIAEDIVAHYMARGYVEQGNSSKAMIVCVDRFTAVRMYDKVQFYWKKQIQALQRQQGSATSAIQREQIREQIKFMRETEMRVVVSSSQNEVRDFKAKGLDIETHRAAMKADLDTQFKNPENTFRVVFVCAMWMTGFDVPSCDTIYLDKPMRNHTLMQTIARANRVYGHKQNGLIVDYIGIFRDLEKALAIYGAADGNGEGKSPVEPKDEQIAALRQEIETAIEFCKNEGIDIDAILAESSVLNRPQLIGDAVEILLKNAETYQAYLNRVRSIDKLLDATHPHPAISELNPVRQILVTIARRIASELTIVQNDLSAVAEEIDALLDDSILTARYIIRDEPLANFYDLSKIDFNALKQRFAEGQKRSSTEALRGAIQKQLERMVEQNRSRMSYHERLQSLIAEYNAGSTGVDEFFSALLRLVDSINEEAQRHIKEGLTEEELALFDLLTRPKKTLSEAERVAIKGIAKQLLLKLKDTLQLDWHKYDVQRSKVKSIIEDVLDQNWLASYENELFEPQVQDIYEHISFAYLGNGRSIYDAA